MVALHPCRHINAPDALEADGNQKAASDCPTSEPDGIACASVARVLLFAVLLGILSGTSCDTAAARTASPRPSVSISSEAQQAIAQARADAASRTGVEADSWRAVEVTRAAVA